MADLFAPGTGYSYYYGDGMVARKKAYEVPEILGFKSMEWREADIDLAHDYSPMSEANVLATVERVYGRKPSKSILS